MPYRLILKCSSSSVCMYMQIITEVFLKFNPCIIMCAYILDVDCAMKVLDHVTVSSNINQQHTVSIIILHSCVYIIHETIIVVN